MSRLKNKSLFWKIQNNNNPCIYLFGSIHIARSQMLGLINQLYPYIQKVESYYAETHLDHIKEHPLAHSVDDTHKVGTVLKPHKLKKLHRLLNISHSMDLDMFKSMHALMAYQMVLSASLNNEEVIYPDQILWDFAKNENKSLDGIESAEFQKDIYENYATKDLKKMLNKVVDKPFGAINELDKLLSIYDSQDLHQLQKNSKKHLGSMRKKLIYKRNVTMAQKLETILSEGGSAFATIGAGHLGGMKGVLRYMKKKGFIVEPVMLKLNKNEINL